MRVLVTGPDGFVGRHLCAFLRQEGRTVAEAPGPNVDGGVDITDKEGLLSVFEQAKPDAIVHLAAQSSVGESHRDPVKTISINVVGTANVLAAARAACPKARVLVVSSGEVYGRGATGTLATEETPEAPLSPYAASKVAAETLALQFHRAYGADVVRVRPFNHLGVGQARRFVVPAFATQIARIADGSAPPTVATGDLSPVRDFLHVEDVVRAYAVLLDHGAPGAVYNLASGEGRTIRSLLDEMLAIANVTAPITVDPERVRPVEIPELVGSAAKLRQLGWTPLRTVREALEETLEEHRNSLADEPSA